jgi:alkylation response protein AidB-like acyl-CoA dehydrogenase
MASSVAYSNRDRGAERGYAAVADAWRLVELVGTLLSIPGTPAQKERYLAPLHARRALRRLRAHRAEAGSDLAGLKTTARRTSAGWTLDGGKLWINSAPVCDFACVLAAPIPAPAIAAMTSSWSMPTSGLLPGAQGE